MQAQTPILKIGTQVQDQDETRMWVTEIRKKTVVFNTGKEVSHAEIEFALDAAKK